MGLAVHAAPRFARLDPIFTSYYSVPTFVLYPLLIVVFGIGPISLIVLGALFGIVAMIVATVTAIDRVPPVLLKVARVARLGPRSHGLADEAAGRVAAPRDRPTARRRL